MVVEKQPENSNTSDIESQSALIIITKERVWSIICYLCTTLFLQFRQEHLRFQILTTVNLYLTNYRVYYHNIVK